MTGRERAKRRVVGFNDLPQTLVKAITVTEDRSFFEHHGINFRGIIRALLRRYDTDPNSPLANQGGSSITQQLVKNLFFGTGRSFLRKGAELTLVPVAELVLGKRRILELYLNVVEWGPGVYGAESACRFYYRTSARNIDRQQATQLAAILPLPLKRRPDHMLHYSGLILERMRQAGW